LHQKKIEIAGELTMDRRSGMTVRQATIFDLDLVAPLFDAYRQFYRKPADLALARSFLLECFQHSESIIFIVIDEGGEALGFAQLFPSFLWQSCRRGSAHIIHRNNKQGRTGAIRI
jgi:hypothetical protein